MTKTFLSIALFLFSGVAVLHAGNLDADRLLQQGIDYFKDGQFQAAADKFTLITQSPYYREYFGIAYFMIGKSDLALNNLKDAAKNNEYFLQNFKDHPYYPEGYYLKSFILFKQGDLDNAILVGEDFIARYPGSEFAANAYFLIGECLYDKGQIDRAMKFYQYVMDKYPTSAKLEAAQYRASLIGFKQRETELLKLLQWSYEDSLQAIEEYKRRESTYEQALAAYQKKLAGGGGASADEVKDMEVKLADRDLQIQSLKSDNASLQQEAALLKDQLAAARAANGGPTASADYETSLEKKQEMLDMKERALTVKEEYLKWLKTYLENKP